MNNVNAARTFLLAVTTSLVLAGCSNLRPVVHEVRYFVLTPEAKPDSAPLHYNQPLGISPVVVPDYLLDKRIAVHRGSSEIHYSENLQWAERIDKNIQRVIAANLTSLLGATNVLLSAWRREEVGAEIHVALERFELDDQGQVTMKGRWLITAPGSTMTRGTGFSTISRPGPSLANNPDDAIQTLSGVLGELSREIAASLAAQAVRGTAQ
jgi:uncharacterized lipoprotein YmbA